MSAPANAIFGASRPAVLSNMSAAHLEDAFAGLRPSERQPVLFIGHGSPLNVLPGNAWHARWQALGQELRARAAAPQLILSISAHWLTDGGWLLTGMAEPRTIHDFGGFPRELYEMQYPAPGAPQVAAALAHHLHAPGHGHLAADDESWGLDHGTWSVLLPMFPEADIPVIQLSIDYARPLAEHYQLGRQLRALRERGVLVVGSGNIVHNLRRMQHGAAPNQAFDWALKFDDHVRELIARGNTADLQKVHELGATMAAAHPTHDHYLPLLYAAAATHEQEAPKFFNEGFQNGSISMRSVLWG